jgi:hypothetical protein
MPTFKINEDTRRELESFKGYMQRQEYTDATITGYRTYLSRFLRQTGLPRTDTLKETIETFLKTEKVDNPRTFKYCRAALHLFYMMVASRAMGRSQITATPELAGLLQRFREYSVEIKHIKEDTAIRKSTTYAGSWNTLSCTTRKALPKD